MLGPLVQAPFAGQNIIKLFASLTESCSTGYGHKSVEAGIYLPQNAFRI
jgi:hypothetical protein